MHPLLTSQPCTIHGDHRPNSHLNHRHHVWPLGDGGPDSPTNVVVVCPTGHENIHLLIRLLKKYNGILSRFMLRGFSKEEIKLAYLGYERLTKRRM